MTGRPSRALHPCLGWALVLLLALAMLLLYLAGIGTTTAPSLQEDRLDPVVEPVVDPVVQQDTVPGRQP